MKLTSKPNNHPDEDVFENYVFERLSEDEVAHFEEHLLICGTCQGTLARIDEYIQLMKAGSSVYVHAREIGSPAQVPLRKDRLRWNAAAAAVLLLTCLTALLSWRSPSGETKTIQLEAYRGVVSQVPSGQPLDLNIDLSDVQQANGYRVEIVDEAGRRVWFGGTPARLTKGLSRGLYWVRLSTETGEPLREYGLNVGSNLR